VPRPFTVLKSWGPFNDPAIAEFAIVVLIFTIDPLRSERVEGKYPTPAPIVADNELIFVKISCQLRPPLPSDDRI
jgi:hypothetical protein